MKKTKVLMIITIVMLFLLITSSISAFTFNQENIKNKTSNIEKFEVVKKFSNIDIRYNDDFVNICISGTNSYTSISGEPILPILIETYEFPLGTKINDIKCSNLEVSNFHIKKQLTPRSLPVIQYQNDINFKKDINMEIYDSNLFYPHDYFSYKTTGGLNKDNIETTFLTIQFNPIRYNPVENLIEFTSNIKLDITYEEPKNSFFSDDIYDLLIISYDKYTSKLEKLVEHKEKYDISTKLVSLSEIYNGQYFDVKGRDNQEKIKYFIADAKENWGITYVMLVGNFNKVPIRYANLQTHVGFVYEELKFACDLYYADLYDSEGNFSSWDTDGDEIYGEWSNTIEDVVDLVPDVYIGRLACMFGFEVTTMVNKIIEYEENTFGSQWFSNIIVSGGDTFNKNLEGGTDFDEGEIANEKALEYMTGFEHIRLYASLDNLTTDNIDDKLTTGAGFIYFVGHGNPKSWATHNNGDYKNWTEGFTNKDMLKLLHKGKYPVLMVGGCHNSQIDVTPLNLIRGILREGIQYFTGDPDDPSDFGEYYMENWVPECWSWVFVKKRYGGAIASMGSTGYGGVNVGDENSNGIPDCIEGLDGWFETQFFRLYNEENIEILGETYGQTVTNYVNNFQVFSDRYTCKIVETHILLGDPTLKIGGYQ